MARTISHDEVEFAGAMAFRLLTVEITDYENGGEALTVAQDLAMSRAQRVLVEVNDGTAAWARWDRENEVIRLYNSSGEVPTADNLDATVEVIAIGRT